MKAFALKYLKIHFNNNRFVVMFCVFLFRIQWKCSHSERSSSIGDWSESVLKLSSVYLTIKPKRCSLLREICLICQKSVRRRSQHKHWILCPNDSPFYEPMSEHLKFKHCMKLSLTLYHWLFDYLCVRHPIFHKTSAESLALMNRTAINWISISGHKSSRSLEVREQFQSRVREQELL